MFKVIIRKMDSFELNKIIAAILMVALLVIGIGKFSDIIFHVEKPKTPGYAIEVEQSATTSTSAKSVVKEKIDVFSTSSTLTFSSGIAATPANLYKCLMVSTGSRATAVQEIQKSDLPQITSSKLTAPSTSFPIYYKEGSNIYILPSTVSSATLDYLFKPTDPNWAFTSGATYGDMAYSSGTSINFQLHDSEEVPLIIKILAFAGVTIKDPNVVQIAKQEEVQKINQENS